MIKVSVVVPVYGVEKYVERCVRSLFDQTMTDGVEFIFVDDCTPDNSIEIIRETLNGYSQRSKQVKFLRHNDNKGLPQARKTGIEAAQGEYIYNVDSDDWLEMTALEKMYEAAVDNDADIIVCDMFYSSDTRSVEVHRPFREKCLLEEMIKVRTPWAVWNKLIRRQLYFTPTPIFFPTDYMGEDMVQITQLVERAKKILYLPVSLYHYYQNPGSFAQQTDMDKVRIWFEMMSRNVEKMIELRGDKNTSSVNDWMRMQAKIMLYPILSEQGGRKEYLSAYKHLNYKILFNCIAPLRARIRHLGVLLGLPKTMEVLKRFKSKINKL